MSISKCTYVYVHVHMFVYTWTGIGICTFVRISICHMSYCPTSCVRPHTSCTYVCVNVIDRRSCVIHRQTSYVKCPYKCTYRYRYVCLCICVFVFVYTVFMENMCCFFLTVRFSFASKLKKNKLMTMLTEKYS